MSATPAQLRAVADAVDAYRQEEIAAYFLPVYEAIAEAYPDAATRAQRDALYDAISLYSPYAYQAVALRLRLEAALAEQCNHPLQMHTNCGPCSLCTCDVYAIVRAALEEAT